MSVDKLKPNDPRVEHKYCDVGNGITYHYMLANPASGKPTATVLLCHGWPDLGMGWRYQVPYLLSLNMQVIVPDMLGYGRTSAPDPFEEYTFSKMTDHMAKIIAEVTSEPVILGGHDWGAWFAWRLCMWKPELIRAVFSFCVPFMAPLPVKTDIHQMVERLPNFRYQLQLASGEAERLVDQSPDHIRGFVNGMFGGRTPEGEVVFSTEKGVNGDVLTKIGPSPMMEKEEVDFYVQEFSRNGYHAPCNWYRTRSIISEEEIPFAREGYQLQMPAMLIMAGRDAALPPSMAKTQGKYFASGLKEGLVPEASHWILVQCPEKSNQFIGEFLESVLGDALKASL